MLRKRLVASACFITPVLGILWLDVNWNFGVPGIWLVATSTLLSLMMAIELTGMIEEKTAGANRSVVFLGVVLVHLAMVIPSCWTTTAMPGFWLLNAIALATTFFAAMCVELFAFTLERKSLERVGLTMASTMYAGWLLTFIDATRLSHPTGVGIFAVFSILFVIKMSDAGAYFAGKNLGKNKLAPILSPGKTIEGLIGGIIAALVAAFVAFWLLQPWLFGTDRAAWWAVVGYSASIAIVGVIGDLCESMIKREMGTKDSSGWLPGLGGILDTGDSVLLAAPLAYVWWASGCLG